MFAVVLAGGGRAAVVGVAAVGVQARCCPRLRGLGDDAWVVALLRAVRRSDGVGEVATAATRVRIRGIY